MRADRPAGRSGSCPVSHEAGSWSRAWLRVAAGMFGVAWGAGQFAPLLLVYRHDEHLSATTVSGLWIIYAIGLLPAMLLAGVVSDRLGRRAVLRVAIVLSAVSSLLLLFGAAHETWALFGGRFFAGIASGAAFAPATAWIKEASTDADESTAARRGAVALSVGFGGGPLVAGLAAAWLPAPDIIPFVIHLTVVLVVGPLVWSAPETRRPQAPARSLRAPSRRSRKSLVAVLLQPEFLRNVLPTAPWVFGTASTATAVLPVLLLGGGSSPALAGAVSAITLGAGVVVQPLGRRLDTRRPGSSMRFGLLITGLGFGLGVATVVLGQPILLVPSGVVLGAAYGLVLVAGLIQVEILAEPDDLATLTAVFYSLSYVGFAAPLVFTLGEKLFTNAEILIGGGVASLLMIALILPPRPAAEPAPTHAGATGTREYLPGR